MLVKMTPGWRIFPWPAFGFDISNRVKQRDVILWEKLKNEEDEWQRREGQKRGGQEAVFLGAKVVLIWKGRLLWRI